MMVRSVEIVIEIRKPWWTHIAFAGAKALLVIGVPINVDRFSQWLAGSFKITSRHA